MSEWSDDVLGAIRTRSDLHRWSAANAHGAQMHRAIDALEAGLDTEDPQEVYSVTTRAIASAMKVIARADDSSGIIGDACRRLLALHPRAALAANVAPTRLVKWMIDFQFVHEYSFFEIDPVAYAPALGSRGVEQYRTQLEQRQKALGPRPQDWAGHEWFVLDWNAQRLAVLDKDVDAIIRTHARDRRVAAWLHDTAKAFAEIEDYDRAIDWARQATYFDRSHQANSASRYWCELLAVHRPDDLLDARLQSFRRWPNSDTATRLYRTAGSAWPDYAGEVRELLSADPWNAVNFTFRTVQDLPLAWQQLNDSDVRDGQLWDDLIAAYAKIDPVAVLPAMRRRVEQMLITADAREYKDAASTLKRMLTLGRKVGQEDEVVDYIAQVRQENRRRPRLQREFDRAGLPGSA